MPPTERSQDPERSMQDLVNDSARPLTTDERKAADRDVPVAEPVYAPASERVPKTVEGYRDVVEHTDTGTPERQAAAQSAPSTPTSATATSASTTEWPVNAEPTFTRVPRPEPGAVTGSTDQPYATDQPYTDADWNPRPNRWMSNLSSGGMLPIGFGWLTFGVCSGIGVWLWMRWRRERNKPINRFRRQARSAATQARDRARDLREQMPDMPDLPDEARRPAIGVGTALVSIAVLLWQQSQRQSRLAEARARSKDVRGRAEKLSSKMSRRAGDTLADVDWERRLQALRDFWDPSRVDLEKVSLPHR